MLQPHVTHGKARISIMLRTFITIPRTEAKHSLANRCRIPTSTRHCRPSVGGCRDVASSNESDFGAFDSCHDLRAICCRCYGRCHILNGPWTTAACNRAENTVQRRRATVDTRSFWFRSVPTRSGRTVIRCATGIRSGATKDVDSRAPANAAPCRLAPTLGSRDGKAGRADCASPGVAGPGRRRTSRTGRRTK